MGRSSVWKLRWIVSSVHENAFFFFRQLLYFLDFFVYCANYSIKPIISTNANNACFFPLLYTSNEVLVYLCNSKYSVFASDGTGLKVHYVPMRKPVVMSGGLSHRNRRRYNEQMSDVKILNCREKLQMWDVVHGIGNLRRRPNLVNRRFPRGIRRGYHSKFLFFKSCSVSVGEIIWENLAKQATTDGSCSLQMDGCGGGSRMRCLYIKRNYRFIRGTNGENAFCLVIRYTVWLKGMPFTRRDETN